MQRECHIKDFLKMRTRRIAVLVVALAIPLCLPAQNQKLPQNQKLTVTAADELAAQQATLNVVASRALTKAGRNARKDDLVLRDQNAGNDNSEGQGVGPTLFPADLAEGPRSGDPLQTTTLHNIYINDPPSAWGDPVGFLFDLNHSDFIHIT